MKILMIVLDGIGDRPIAELGYRTPLDAAATPRLDRVADIGVNGQFFSMAVGVAPATDLAHLIMFGYRREDYPGRAVMESIAAGVELDSQTVVMRARFVSAEERAGRFEIVNRNIAEGKDDIRMLAGLIVNYQTGGFEFELNYLQDEQADIYVRAGASQEITDSDPLLDGYPIAKVLPFSEAYDYQRAKDTAKAVNEYLIWVHEVLSESEINKRREERGFEPVNFLVSKWAGKIKSLEKFEDKWGLKAALIGSHPAIKGLSLAIGMKFVEHLDRKDPELNLSEQFELADDMFSQGYEFVVVHCKAADDAAHYKEPLRKRDVIEKLDNAFDALYSMPSLTEDLLLVVTADHSTPSIGPLIHSGEPVPITIAGPNLHRDDVEVFSESVCHKGALGRLMGSELLPLLLTYTDRVKYSGSRITADDRIYMPKEIEPMPVPEKHFSPKKRK